MILAALKVYDGINEVTPARKATEIISLGNGVPCWTVRKTAASLTDDKREIKLSASRLWVIILALLSASVSVASDPSSTLVKSTDLGKKSPLDGLKY